MPKTMLQVRASLGKLSSRVGLCNSPHPDPKHLTTVEKWDAESETWTTTTTPTVRCARFDGHDGDCTGYAFLISRPDTWPKPTA